MDIVYLNKSGLVLVVLVYYWNEEYCCNVFFVNNVLVFDLLVYFI